MTALETQKELWEKAMKFYTEERDPTEEQKDVLEKWGWTLDRLDEDPESLERHVEWIMKRKWMGLYVESRLRGKHQRREDENYNSLCAQFDTEFTRVDPERSFFNRLQSAGHAERIITDDEIKLRIQEPPHTRAMDRSRLLTHVRLKGLDASAGWSYMQIEDGETPILLQRPHIEEFAGLTDDEMLKKAEGMRYVPTHKLPVST